MNNPPGKANGITQVVPPFAGHKPGIYTPSLEGHAPGDFGVGKSTFDEGFATSGSKTTSGAPARYALGIPD